MLLIEIRDCENKCIAAANGEKEVNLFYNAEYKEGDSICLKANGEGAYVWLQVDDALGKSLLYVKGELHYIIPFDEKRYNISPKAFYGNKHLISAKIAVDYELSVYRNLAINVNDQHENTTSYPHASANVETRGEAVFAASNAIDGVTINCSHGEWPFESWGINKQDDAKLKIDFGRVVEIDKIVLYTRADFPHDNWWEMATVNFSDESSLKLQMKKSSLPHEFTFDKKKISWLELEQLEKADDPSPFPALTQIEVYGIDL